MVQVVHIVDEIELGCFEKTYTTSLTRKISSQKSFGPIGQPSIMRPWREMGISAGRWDKEISLPSGTNRAEYCNPCACALRVNNAELSSAKAPIALKI